MKTNAVPDALTRTDGLAQTQPPRIPDLVVFLAFTVAVFSLLLLASISTCVLGSYQTINEHTYFLSDSLARNVALCLSAVLVCLIASRLPFSARVQSSINGNERVFNWCRAILLALLLVVGLVVAFTFQISPRADARIMQDVAHAVLQHDYGFFDNGAYIGAYPHQIGLVWFSCLLAKLFGEASYLAFRVLNALALCGFFLCMTGIVAHLGGSRCQQLASLALGFAFFPLFFYICFLYGTLLGLAFATLGLYWELKALDGSPVLAIPCAISLAFAAFMKHNYFIFAIAVVLFAIMRVARENWKAVLLVVLFTPTCCFAVSAGALELGRSLSGYDLDQGTSSWSWIAMGLQDGDLGPGWFNGYNAETYLASGCDTTAQTAVAKQDIAKSIADMVDNPHHAAQFFIAKTASQWANPGFQGHWLIYTPPVETGVSEWVLKVSSQEAEQSLLPYLDALETLVLFGAFISCVLLPGRIRKEPAWVLLALIFLGGFTCHLAWEAKCQYTIVYYLLLFPFSVRGYAMVPDALWWIRELPQQLRSGLQGQEVAVFRVYGAALAVLCLVVLVLLVATGSVDRLTSDVMGDVGVVARGD